MPPSLQPFHIEKRLGQNDRTQGWSHGAQEAVSRAHDADGNDWSGLSAQDLIFRHQRRPLLSERERNHRSRPPFYEAAAGRDLLLLALQPVCGQFSEFPKARFQCTRQRPMRPSTPVPSCREQTGRRPASSFEPCGHRSPSERRVEGCHWQPRNAAAVLGTHATPKARCSFPLSPSKARKS